MKRLIIFVFVLVTAQLFAQINPVYISPVKVGNMNLQAGKVFYQNTFGGATNLPNLAVKFKSKEQVYSVFNLNSATSTEIKGTITNFQLNIDQYGVKRKKLAAFLVLPLNATFNIETVAGRNKITVSNIWFKNLPGDKSLGNRNIEAMVTSGSGTVFLKKKKNLKSITVIEKNLDELFSAATGGGMGF
ncbi:MAG: hypothetical protein Q8N05_14955 [Bacteroidota bacterium]|nr:hypothetical protein [Bacteroidota bacterium]